MRGNLLRERERLPKAGQCLESHNISSFVHLAKVAPLQVVLLYHNQGLLVLERIRC